jgi:hypothetical protein
MSTKIALKWFTVIVISAEWNNFDKNDEKCWVEIRRLQKKQIKNNIKWNGNWEKEKIRSGQ